MLSAANVSITIFKDLHNEQEYISDLYLFCYRHPH